MVLSHIVWKHSTSLIYVCQKYVFIKVPVSIYPLKVHNKGQGKNITAENQVLKMKLIVVPVPAYFLGSKQQMETAGVYILKIVCSKLYNLPKLRMQKYRSHTAFTQLDGLKPTRRLQEITGMVPLKTILIQCPFTDNLFHGISSIQVFPCQLLLCLI